MEDVAIDEKRMDGKSFIMLGTLLARWWVMPAFGILLGSAMAAVWSNHQVRRGRETAEQPIQVRSEDRFDPSIAQPDFSPEHVVRLQLDSLKRTAIDPDALIVCYSLAAPANRIATGPIDRFSRLIQTPAYEPLIGHRHALVGRAVAFGANSDQVSVFVTIADENAAPSAFRFYLSKQSESPFAGCWMTTGVKPFLTPSNAPQDGSS